MWKIQTCVVHTFPSGDHLVYLQNRPEAARDVSGKLGSWGYKVKLDSETCEGVELWSLVTNAPWERLEALVLGHFGCCIRLEVLPSGIARVTDTCRPGESKLIPIPNSRAN